MQNLRRTVSEQNVAYKTEVKKPRITKKCSFADTPRLKNKFQSTFNAKQEDCEKNSNLWRKAQQRTKGRKASCHQEKYKEKGCSMLLAIVFLFVLTHSFRLAFKFYEVLVPNTAEHFERCLQMNRYSKFI